MENEPVSIFISYSHHDEEHRRNLVSHLATLKRLGLVKEWHDRMIKPGEDGNLKIDEQLGNADIVLLLISADFISSLFCWEVELERGLKRHAAGEAVVIPIVVRPTDLSGVPFAAIQSLPTDRVPVTRWDDRDEAWLDVIKGLRTTIDIVQERRKRSNEPRRVESIGHILGQDDPEVSNDGLATGYAELDLLLGGLQPSELVVVAGRPGMGKTAFALNVAANAALGRKKTPVLLFSMDTPSNEMSTKILSSLSQVDSSSLRQGHFDDTEWSRINFAIGMLRTAPIFIDDSPTLTSAEILKRAQVCKEEHGLGLVIIDHWQMIRSDSPASDLLQSDRPDIAKDLKSIARTLNVPVISISQINGKVDTRFDRRPTLQDLPEGERIQDFADIVLFLYREEAYDPNTTRIGIVDVSIAKHRKGPVGNVALTFLSIYSSFHNLIVEPDHRAG